MGIDDENAVIACEECGENDFEVTGYGPAGINPEGRCRSCGSTVSQDDAYWADMKSQIANDNS